jgi:hypothetical protein
MSDRWFYSLETGEILRPHERGFDVMVEADGAAPTTARKIVKAVNNHDALLSFVKQITSQESIDDTYSLLKKGRELLAQIERVTESRAAH